MTRAQGSRGVKEDTSGQGSDRSEATGKGQIGDHGGVDQRPLGGRSEASGKQIGGHGRADQSPLDTRKRFVLDWCFCFLFFFFSSHFTLWLLLLCYGEGGRFWVWW